MQNALLRAKRISFFGAVAASSELACARSTRRNPIRDPWMDTRQDRREAYVRGEGRPSEAFIGALTAEYPVAGKVWRSRVWEFLDPDAAERSCESRLFEECELPRSAYSVDALLAWFRLHRPTSLDSGLDEVSLLVLALRVARRSQIQDETFHAAANLAKALLLLGGCPYRRAASEQLWLYCGRTLVRGIKDRSRSLSFEKSTWDFVADHAMAANVTFRMLAYASPFATELPFSVTEEMLRDLVAAFTTSDSDRATFINSQFNAMSPHRRQNQPHPDFETLSIWRPVKNHTRSA